MEPMWLRKPRTATTIVFVHGLLSSSETAWLHPTGAFWPKLVCEDSQLQGCGVYLFSYRTDINAGTFSLENAVDAMRERFRLDGLTENVNVGSGLIFVCHSMGGILARRYVVAQQLVLVDRKIPVGLFLIASPSLGSDYANFVTSIAPFYNAQIDILRFSQENQWLNALDKDFINIKEGERLTVHGKELIEDNFIGTNRFFRKTQIVKSISGARYFGEPVKIEHTDHFTIAKPISSQSIQHRLLVEFVNAVAGKYSLYQSTEDRIFLENDDSVLINWAQVFNQRPPSVSKKTFRRELLYENRLKVAAVCLLPFLSLFGFLYLSLLIEKGSELFLLRNSDVSIQSKSFNFFRHTDARKIVKFSDTGSFESDAMDNLKHLGPIAVVIDKTSYPQGQLFSIPNFPLPSGMGSLSNIVGLGISDASGLDNFDPLGNMPYLKGLAIFNIVAVNSLYFLTKIPNLQYLHINKANIIDLEPLASLGDLTHLTLHDLPRVNDLKPLKRLSKLQCIDLRGLPEAKDIDFLFEMSSLKTILTDKPLSPQLEQKQEQKQGQDRASSCF